MKDFLKKVSSISTLAGVVLAVLAFCPRGNSVTTVFLVLFTAVWAAIKLSLWVWATAQAEVQTSESEPHRIIHTAQARNRSHRTGTRMRRSDGFEFEIPDLDDDEMDKDDPQSLLLSSVCSHITDLLQGFYPGASWKWQCTNPLEQIVNGGVARIQLMAVPGFTYADVSFEDLHKMDIQLIHSERLARPVQAPEAIPEPVAAVPIPMEPSIPFVAVETKPQETDVNVWYSMIGQHALEQIITDLNVRGCRKLTIDESGAVYAAEDGKEAKKELTLDRMPAMRYWDDLKQILGEQDLTATIADNQLVIGW